MAEIYWTRPLYRDLLDQATTEIYWTIEIYWTRPPQRFTGPGTTKIYWTRPPADKLLWTRLPQRLSVDQDHHHIAYCEPAHHRLSNDGPGHHRDYQ